MNRRHLPYILLPEDPAGPVVPPGGVPPVPQPPPPPGPGRAFSQEEVDALIGREKSVAARTAKQQLLTQFGFATTEEAAAALTAAKAAADAQKTADQRAADAQAAAAKAVQETAGQRHALRIERALYQAGISPSLPDGSVNPAVGMAARLVDVDQAADDGAVLAAVQQVKTSVPIWFTPATPPPGTDPGRGPLPQQQPPGTQSLQDMMAAARQFHGTAPSTAS